MTTTTTTGKPMTLCTDEEIAKDVEARLAALAPGEDIDSLDHPITRLELELWHRQVAASAEPAEGRIAA